MRNPEDLHISEVLNEELINDFAENRSVCRQQAKDNIAKIQAENAKQYNKKRKEARLYTVGELVAIERTQNEKGLKFRTIKSQRSNEIIVTRYKKLAITRDQSIRRQ